MTRTDIHRTSAIVPDDYRVRFWYSHGGSEPFSAFNIALMRATFTGETVREPIFKFNGIGVTIDGYREVTSPWGKLDYFKSPLGGNCHVCGAWHLHGTVYEHVPTGEHIAVGHICADKLDLAQDGGAAFYDAKKRREQIRKAMKVRSERRRNLYRFAEQHPEHLPLLKVDHRIARDIRRKVIAHPEWFVGEGKGLSTGQVALLEKLAREAVDRANAPVEEPREHYAAAVGDRIEVEVTLLARVYLGENGYGSSKYLLKFEDADRHLFTTFTTGEIAYDVEDLDERATFKIVGTVKALDEYRGEKQAVLTRARAVMPALA